jgi:hypothetical protein
LFEVPAGDIPSLISYWFLSFSTISVAVLQDRELSKRTDDAPQSLSAFGAFLLLLFMLHANQVRASDAQTAAPAGARHPAHWAGQVAGQQPWQWLQRMAELCF